MSASITIGSLSLASDGKTLTGTLSGGSGSGYSPSSGVTGLTVKQGGFILQPSSNAISGTTLTINLAAAGTSGGTITLDVSVSSNLSDNGSNTATAATGSSVTNNSTVVGTNIAGNNANVVLTGSWPTGSVASRTAYNPVAQNGQIDLAFSLSAQADLCLMAFFFSGNPVSYSLDGGSFTTPTIPVSSSAYTISLVVPAISSGSHTLVIRGISTLLSNVDQATMLQFKGGVPTMSTPTGLGTATAGVFTGENRTQYLLNDPANSPYLIAEGDVNIASTAVGYSASGKKLTQIKHPVSTLKARVKGTDLWAWLYGTGNKITVRVNGVDQGGVPPTTTTLPNNSVLSWVKIATGLDGTNFQTVLITDVTIAGGTVGGPFYYALMPTGGSAPAVELVTTQSARIAGAAYGDSITAVALGVTAVEKGHPYLLAYRFDHAMFSDGVAGSKISDVSASSGKNRTAGITAATPATNLSYLIVHYGINDALNSVTLGNAATSGTLIGDCKLMLNSLLSGLPVGTKIIYLGLMGSSTAAWSAVSPYNTGIQTAIAACSAPSRITFVDPSTQMKIGGAPYYAGGSFDSTNFSDGLHPNVLGYDLIDNSLAPHILSALGSAAYSVSGPSFGTINTASASFTVTLGQSATFNGWQTVTLTASSGDTITATAAGGSISGNGTGTVIVTPASGQTNFTFTYTATAVGTRSVTYTNGQGWTNPSASTLMATDPDSSSSSTSSASSASSASSDSSSSPSSASSASSDSSSSHSSASSASTDSSSSLSSASSESSDSSSLSSQSSSSSASSESSESETFIPPTPTIISVHPVDVPDDGEDIIIYNRPFEMTISDLDPDAFVNAFVNGIFYVAGDVTDVNKARFSGTKLPLGRKQLTITQVVDGNESDSSASRLVRINRADNVVGRLPAPTITPAGGTFFSFPVTVTITSSVGGDILYVVDGTGYSQPTILYTGPFKMYQTGVVRARVMYQGQKGESTIQTIRIVR